MSPTSSGGGCQRSLPPVRGPTPEPTWKKFQLHGVFVPRRQPTRRGKKDHNTYQLPGLDGTPRCGHGLTRSSHARLRVCAAARHVGQHQTICSACLLLVFVSRSIILARKACDVGRKSSGNVVCVCVCVAIVVECQQLAPAFDKTIKIPTWGGGGASLPPKLPAPPQPPSGVA